MDIWPRCQMESKTQTGSKLDTNFANPVIYRAAMDWQEKWLQILVACLTHNLFWLIDPI